MLQDTDTISLLPMLEPRDTSFHVNDCLSNDWAIFGKSLEDCGAVGLFSTSAKTEIMNGLLTMALAELSCKEVDK